MKTALAGAVGCDDLGDAILARISAHGVDVTGVLRDPDAPTSAVIVLVDPAGERSFLYRSGANERLRHEAVHLSGKPRLVHVGGAMKLLQLDLKKALSAPGYKAVPPP